MHDLFRGLFRTKNTSSAVLGGAALYSGLPQKAVELAYDRMTAKVVIPANVWYFKELCQHLEKNSFNYLSNTLVLDTSNVKAATVGFGTSWSRFMDSVVKVVRDKADKEERITITFFLTSKEDATSKIETFTKTLRGDTKASKVKRIDIYKSAGKDLSYVKTDIVRKEESIFVEPGILEYINKRIDEFLTRKTWYADRGIPYKYAIILHGEPGTGKTSIAKYIAGRLDRALVIVSPMDIVYHTGNLSRNVALMEDIDCDMTTLDRGKGGGQSKAVVEGGGAGFLLGDLLNAIDGVNSIDDCILIGTTNHKDKIDPALLRKGRFDDVIEIKPLQTAEIIRMVKFFFDRQDLTGFVKYRPTVGAVIQDLIMNHYSEGAEKLVEILNRDYAVTATKPTTKKAAKKK